jgi:flavin reductase (NADH)
MKIIRLHPEDAGQDLVGREEFRHAFRQLATTVGVLTYRDAEGRPRGMTATSLCAVSADPPSLLVCVDRRARTHEALEFQTEFGLALLAEDQREIALWCARPGADKRLRPEWLGFVSATTRTPRLLGAVAHFECTIDRIEPAFTHSIVIGVIRETIIEPAARPLLYHDGTFGRLDDEP